MKILIIEDLQHKADELKKHIKEKLSNVDIEVRMSYNSGLEEVILHHNKYDLILLDMSMQNYDITRSESGGEPINMAGLHILDQMYFKEIDNKVVVVTMYGNFGEGGRMSLFDLDKKLKDDFPDNYLGHVFFSTSDDKWKEDLNELIQKNIEND